MVAEIIIAGLITEIIDNRILGNPIFHRFGKKAMISPSLSKVMLMIGLFLTAAALMTCLKNQTTSQMSRVHSLGQLRISSRSLERVNLTKLLGIHFSEHLSWEDCMSANCQKSCHSALGILRKIKTLQEILTSQ